MSYSMNEQEKDEGRELIASLTSLAEIMTVRQGEELQLAEAGSCLYFVLRGKVEVSYLADDTRIIVAVIGGGNFLGEIGFFDGISRLRNMRAFEETEILVFARETLRQLEKDDPQLLIRLLFFTARTICRKFRAVVEEYTPPVPYATAAMASRQMVAEPMHLEPDFFLTTVGRSALRLVEDLKTDLFDVSRRLQEDASQEIPPALASQCFAVFDRFYGQLVDFSRLLDSSASEEAEQAWSYLFKEIFPYFMRSRFAERIYYKPKGFAGDFLTMEMIYRDVPEGDGKLGRLVDEWCLKAKGAKAIRERRRLMALQLRDLVAARRKQADIRLLNLGCGASRELFDFLGRCKCTEKIEVFCVDADTDALHFISHSVDTSTHRAQIRLMQENIVKWALGRVKHDLGLFDCIYSVGLADYLDDCLFKAFINRCYKKLRPGGMLVLWNFIPNPDQLLLDNILNWRLCCRTGDHLRQLFAESPFGSEIELLAETGSTDLCVGASKRA